MESTHSQNEEGQTEDMKQTLVRQQKEEVIVPLTFFLPSESSPSSKAKLSMKPS